MAAVERVAPRGDRALRPRRPDSARGGRRAGHLTNRLSAAVVPCPALPAAPRRLDHRRRLRVRPPCLRQEPTMNKHSLDNMTTAALRELDPAPTMVLTDEELERADATFARIVATPSPDQVPQKSLRARRRRSLVVVGLVAAGAAVPAMLVSGGSAFASWTPQPESLTAAAMTEAATTCRAALEVPDQGERVVIAEQRGGWTYVLIAGHKSEGFCLMPDDLVGRQDPADHKKGFFGGYTADPVEAPTLARDRIVETESMTGSVPTPGPWFFSDHDGWFSSVQGYVGSGVTGVTVHPPVGPDVEASVANGRFAAWWPSEEPSSRNPEVMGAWTYTVTLADGSTRRVTGCFLHIGQEPS